MLGVEERGAMSGEGTGGVGGFLLELRRSLLIDASKKIVWWVLGAIAAGVALIIWQGGSVPAWTLLLTVVVLLAVAILWRWRTNRELVAVTEEAEAMAYGLERHGTYSKHVAQSLDALQRVVSGDIDVPIPRYIEQAILEPARDLLMEKPAENVRLSVLLPDDDTDAKTWFMPWAAGHTLTGKAKYDEPIADTLSRHAYESGAAKHWPDVTTDSAFKQNPDASAPIRAMFSLPVKYGDDVLGVFNVVSSEPDAFDPAEEIYIRSLAGVLSVAVGVHLKEALGGADGG